MVEITKKIKSGIPKLPLNSIKNKILGEKYNLSVVFCGEKLIADLNKKYRHKNKPTDVLSFNINKQEGEIFICPSFIKKHPEKYPPFNLQKKFGFIAIHALLHLKGMQHSSKMERRENEFLKIFFK